MPNRRMFALALPLLCSVAAMAQTAAPAPTSQAADADDLESLKRKIKEQERRLSQLEALKGEDTVRQIQREEILKILKEMKVEADKHADLRVYWKDGIRMDTADGDFKLHLGTRIQVDSFYSSENGFKENKPLKNTDIQDGVEFRRVYLVLDGQIYKDVEFKFEYDFAGQTSSNAKPQDVYVKFTHIPVLGAITAGHFKEPFSLEQLTSDANTTFMERSLMDALVPGRNMGIMANDAVLKDANKAERVTWAAGIFKDTNDWGFNQTDGGYAGTWRMTALPWYENKGEHLIHVGAAYSYRETTSNLQYRSRPEAHMAPYLVDTGSFLPDNASLFNGELATVVGPWHAEGEFTSVVADPHHGNSGCLNGWYAQTGYFLTGESRPYKTSTGTWDRVKPKKNFREDGGWGAWEIAARYSYLDLTNEDLGFEGIENNKGGRMQNVTAGLNWYLNPNTRIMWNYVRSGQGTWDTSTDMFLMRFQIDF